MTPPDPTSVETAALPRAGDADEPEAALPRILGREDVALYNRIFTLQRPGDWRTADSLIARLGDPLLLGHVLYQRYMHPTKYRSKYKELKAWMQAYADHPGARRVYRLALRRQPKNWRAPRRPVGVTLGPAAGETDAEAERPKVKKLRVSRSKRRHARYVLNQVKSMVRHGRPTSALKLLSEKRHKRGMDRVSYDKALAIVARGYYHAEKDAKALAIATRAASSSGIAAPMSHWWAGLAAWRLGYAEVAAGHFSALAESGQSDPWISAAAAFWASRGLMRSGQAHLVTHMLSLAAKHPRTFYGLLATRALGVEPAFDWELPRIGPIELDLLASVPAAKRALALIQVGEAVRAEAELKRFTGSLSPQLARVLLGLTAKANLPGLAFRLGNTLERTGGERYDAALYPLPDWRPEGGFRIDRALVFALIRQESGFKAKAKSRAGARGLMQLMPRTARWVGGREFRRAGRHKLFEPEFNIALGQKYVRMLLVDPKIDTNLFYATAAYNGGPGNLNKWRRSTDYRDDPLLFIESIPSRETRLFIERVMTNLWIYRHRLGQPAPSLDKVAAGDWPRYNGLDDNDTKVVTRGD